MLDWTLTIAFVALVLERLIGYPKWLQWILGHPVIWMGRFLAYLDHAINVVPARRITARTLGLAALFCLIGVSMAITVPLVLVLRTLPHGWIYEALLAIPLLAQFELRESVDAVAKGLEKGLEEGRDAVRHIVGRDPQQLDESGIARAALESLAENTSDAIVAPAFWLAIFGLPGIAVYKAINTADSMIGHKSERFINFGWAAARLDDLVNLPCSRLTGVLFAAAASLTSPSRGAEAIEFMMRDAHKHQSPNAGWPEAALAGALEIRLGGPRFYDGIKVDLPWMGRGRQILNARHVRQGLALQGRMLTLFTGLMGLLAIFTP